MRKSIKYIKNPKLLYTYKLKKILMRLCKRYNYKFNFCKNIKTFNFDDSLKYEIILHSGENLTGLSHLDLWIPYFELSEVKYIILVRNINLYEKLKSKYKNISLIYANKHKEIDIILKKLPYIKACFYPSNTGNNLHLLYNNSWKHIFIGHGDSDKTASAHKYFRVYDENWVAGDAHIDRFKNAGFDFSGLEHIRVGRPNLKEVLEISSINWRSRFYGKLNFLYLSTWEGVYSEQNYTSVYIIDKFFASLKKCNISKLNIKLHPRVGSRDSSLKDIEKKFKLLLSNNNIEYNIYTKETLVEELIKKSNIFICDISAVVSECLSANAPIFVYIPKDKEIKLSKSKMSYNYYTYTFSTIEELINKLEEVIINNNDYLAKNREEAMEYILGKEETLNDMFIKELKKIGNKRL